ncbi:MAG TPA: M1 family aminopeptidase [Gemmatimonadales bacterium]|jgi:hypothetical protein|nr:M1 family aminopeptidase [Gemmatimonadales bacterium]
MLFALALVAAAQSYDSVFDQLKNLAPVRSGVAVVRGLTLRRDVMTLQLDSGFAYLLTPVAGRTVGIAFVGSGSITFTPPLAVERFNLKRTLGDSTITGPIGAAVFVFADSTGAELGRSLTFGIAPAGSPAPDPSGAVHDALDYLIDGRSRSADANLIAALLNQTTTGYFSAYIQRKRGESVMVQYDPQLAEEVLLYRRGKMVGQRVETVCQFQRLQDLVDGVQVASEHPEPLAIDAYDIEASIDPNYKFSARATLQLIGRRDQQRWAPFYLYSELDVDSITSKGQSLAFYRRNNESALWIRFPAPVGPGDTALVRVVYHGSVIGFGSALDAFLPSFASPLRREMTPLMDNWAFIKSTETWYPRYSFEQSAAITLTFHTPKDRKFASIGRLVDSRTEGNVTTSHWVSELPTNSVSFNIGEFDELEIKDPRIPPVTVHVNTDAHRIIRRVFPSSGRPEESVGSDIANSLSFFTQVFGPPLFHHYYATEIPYFHGQAFPGMIHLSWMTYVGWSKEGNDESFRAHEMAHQWWGIGVEAASYRDVWLSEGFSEFAGLWYMQIILHDNDKYLEKLKESREEIRRERNKAVPIGLGVRAAESWRGHYELTTYQKGAWVLHMLRNMMMDTRTMSEDRFKAMMREFYETYRGKRASTLDFQRTVEKHFGQPMDWFFNEWVYGTAVPTYTFSWTATRDSTGITARVRVRQDDVPESFAMYVPILIKFDEGEAIVRVLVRGATTDGTFRLPAQPKSMQLNPLESVLAEVKMEPYRP